MANNIEQLLKSILGGAKKEKDVIGDLIELATAKTIKQIMEQPSAATAESEEQVRILIDHEKRNMPLHGAGAVVMSTTKGGIATGVVGEFSLSDFLKIYLTLTGEIRNRLMERMPEPIADNVLLELLGTIIEHGDKISERTEVKM